MESRRKKKEKKREDGDIWVYVCGGEKTREKKKKKKGNVWMKYRNRDFFFPNNTKD